MRLAVSPPGFLIFWNHNPGIRWASNVNIKHTSHTDHANCTYIYLHDSTNRVTSKLGGACI